MRSSFKLTGYAILFCLILIVLDQAIGSGLASQYGRIFTGPGRYNYMKSKRFDCLVMGSSTSTCYYDDILSKCLGISVLNVGLDGSALIYSRSILDLVVKYNVKPSMIILNIDLFEFRKSAWSGNYYSMIEKFRPIYGQSDYVDNALMKERPFEKLKYLFLTYRFNDMPLSLMQKRLDGSREYRRDRSPQNILQLPIDEKTIKEKFSDELDIDERKISLLKEFISECKKLNIMTILVESPIYYPDRTMTDRDRKLAALVRKTADDMNAPLIALTQDACPVFKDHDLFKDVLHLNDRGSVVFTNLVCGRLENSKRIVR